MATRNPYDGPARHALSVTPSDSADLPNGVTRALYVGVSGNLVVLLADSDSSVTVVNVAAGVVHPFRVKRVYSTGTTATNILALY